MEKLKIDVFWNGREFCSWMDDEVIEH